MKKKFLLLFFGVVLALGACSNQNDEKGTEMNEEDKNIVEENDSLESSTEKETTSAKVDLIDNEGLAIGNVELTEEENGVRLKVSATGLPAGQHGFHFHEVGKCELPNFESAEGHFNPTDASHGLENEDGPHAGDLPNLEVAEDGTVEEEVFAEHVTLKKDEPNSLFQAGDIALIIHAEADDGTSQPSGDSGDRIACGIVE